MSFDSLNEFASTGDDDLRGKWFIGVVTDANDTTGQGRVKANVPGLFDTNSGDVPWIGPLKQSLFGIGPGFGFYGTPQKGAKITVILQDGDPHYPAYIGGILTAADVPAEFKDPNVWGFKDPAGNMLIVNMQAKTFRFVTADGVQISSDGSGNFQIQTSGNVKVQGAIINLN